MSCSVLPDENLIADVVEARLRPYLEKLIPQVSKEYFSVKEAALYTGLSQKFIRRAIKSAILPCSNPGGEHRSTLRIAKKDIDDWMSRTRLKAAPARVKRNELVDKFFPSKRSA